MAGREYIQTQMYRLDMQTLNWDIVGTRESMEGATPGTLDEHTATLHGNHVYIFGGFEDGSRVNKIHAFDVEHLTWQLVEPADERADKPKPRAGHSATMINECLYVFGGKDDENEKLNDLWKFDINLRKWTQLIQEPGDPVPMNRSGHSAVAYKNYICIFGGIFEVTKELNDFHMYDVEKNKWI